MNLFGRIFFRCCIFFTLIEVLLHLSGQAFIAYQRFANHLHLSGGQAYRILCVGDSTTIGETAYPVSLEKVLNARFPHKRFEVIKEGVSSASTNYIANRLDSWIGSYHPQMVIVMSGVNDDKYYRERKDAKVHAAGDSGPFIWHMAKGLVQKAKDYVRSTYRHPPPPAPVESMAGNEKKYEIPRTWQILLDKQNPDHERMVRFYAYLKQADYLNESGDLKASEALINALSNVPVDPAFSDLLLELRGRVYYKENRMEELILVSWQLLQNEPYNVAAMDWVLYMCGRNFQNGPIDHVFSELTRRYPKNYRYQELWGICYEHRGDMGRRRSHMGAADRIKMSTLNPVTVESFQRIKSTAKQRGVKLILMQYPLNDVRILKNIFRGDPDYDGLIFVDNKSSFEGFLASHPYSEVFVDRCCGNFGHTGETGSGLVARNIVEQIAKDLY